ncbi:MAG: outer membrane lipoprotein carrier protein LolA [Holophagaceae bacterium]|nr:outer membrane lipoprotein carrier protein LolA [Holophagaceae bacterium]
MGLPSAFHTAVYFCLGAALAYGQELPPWWKAFANVPRIQSAFVQTSDSAVFGKLKRKGSVRLAKGGRLRVVYEDGLELVADGRSLIQFDPDTRTAQRMELSEAAREAPLLRLLTDPTKLGGTYAIEPSPNGQVWLKPLKKGLPEVRVEGSGSLPKRLMWTDASGAGQVLELLGANIPAKPFPAGTFDFQPPKNTRWLGK